MAERMLVAFGRYLRMLRERRGLSLDEVEALTRAYPEPVMKAYLSRIENGKSRIAFSKMVALCRAYEYPIDAAAERLALDLEVDRLPDAPDTSRKTVKELLVLGRTSIHHGMFKHAYARARDATVVARTGPLSDAFSSFDDQYGVCLMNTANAGAKLGYFRFAKAEYRYLDTAGLLSPKHAALLLERTAVALWKTGELAEAATFADRAITMASRSPRSEFLATMLTTRAIIASASGDDLTAVELYVKALRGFQELGAVEDRANAMANLAESYLRLRRFGAARRILNTTLRIAESNSLARVHVRVLILRGELAIAEGSPEAAEPEWNDALRIAKGLGDVPLIFHVKFLLWRAAVRTGRHAIARRLAKALNGLAPWIPQNTEELVEFRTLILEARSNAPGTGLHAGNQVGDRTET